MRTLLLILMTRLERRRSRESSDFMKGRKGRTWLHESRSHMASISPVIMKVSEEEWKPTVVSRVLGNVFEKS